VKAETVPFDFADKTYQTYLTFRDIKQLKSETGFDLITGTGVADPETIIAFITRALQKDDPDITVEFVEEHFRLNMVAYYTDYFERLAGGGDPEGDDPKAPKGKAKGKG
jgi:hypothetical protein